MTAEKAEEQALEDPCGRVKDGLNNGLDGTNLG